MSKTQENLQSAFAGESQANRKYLAFAKKAEVEGKKNLAKLFRAAAEGETVHALNHFNVLGGVKESADNLKVAIEGETYEIEKMYPDFLEGAETENDAAARQSMDRALKVEIEHQELFREALGRVEKGEDIDLKEYYICSVCGHVALGEAPEICPVCGAPKEKFKKVE